MNITLNAAQQKFVKHKIKTGNYDSPQEVVTAALEFLQSDPLDNLPPDQLAELRKLIAVGAAQADRGEYVDFTAQDIIRQETKRRRAKKRAGK